MTGDHIFTYLTISWPFIVIAVGFLMTRRITDRPPNCDECGKPRGGKGYFGPECMCAVKTGHGAQGAHSAGQTRKVRNDQA